MQQPCRLCYELSMQSECAMASQNWAKAKHQGEWLAYFFIFQHLRSIFLAFSVEICEKVGMKKMPHELKRERKLSLVSFVQWKWCEKYFQPIIRIDSTHIFSFLLFSLVCCLGWPDDESNHSKWKWIWWRQQNQTMNVRKLIILWFNCRHRCRRVQFPISATMNWCRSLYAI